MRMITAVFLAAVCVGLVSCGKGKNTLVVTNHSGLTADQVAVTVSGKDYLFSDLKNGATVSTTFAVKYDSSCAVSVLMGDGNTSTNEFGAMSGGAKGHRIEIEITEDQKVVGKVL